MDIPFDGSQAIGRSSSRAVALQFNHNGGKPLQPKQSGWITLSFFKIKIRQLTGPNTLMNRRK